MKSFADTSALFALLDAGDADHIAVATAWEKFGKEQPVLFVTSYVLLETFALIQRRLGMKAVRGFQQGIVPLLNVMWVGPDLHAAGLAAMLAANRRGISLVDCVSFAAMRESGISRVFSVDPHFREQGFQVCP